MAARVTELKVMNDALDDAGELRRRILKACEASGWLVAGTPFEETIADIEAAKKARLVFPYSGINREHAAI